MADLRFGLYFVVDIHTTQRHRLSHKMCYFGVRIPFACKTMSVCVAEICASLFLLPKMLFQLEIFWQLLLIDIVATWNLYMSVLNNWNSWGNRLQKWLCQGIETMGTHRCPSLFVTLPIISSTVTKSVSCLCAAHHLEVEFNGKQHMTRSTGCSFLN